MACSLPNAQQLVFSSQTGVPPPPPALLCPVLRAPYRWFENGIKSLFSSLFLRTKLSHSCFAGALCCFSRAGWLVSYLCDRCKPAARVWWKPLLRRFRSTPSPLVDPHFSSSRSKRRKPPRQKAAVPGPRIKNFPPSPLPPFLLPCITAFATASACNGLRSFLFSQSFLFSTSRSVGGAYEEKAEEVKRLELNFGRGDRFRCGAVRCGGAAKFSTAVRFHAR